MKKKTLDSPQAVRTNIEELEVLARLKDTVEWAIAKRVALKYITNIQKKAFWVPETHPNFKEQHIDYTGQVRGIKMFIKMIDGAAKRLEEEEKRNE